MEPFWADLENRFLRLHKEQTSAKGNGFLYALNHDGEEWTVGGSTDSVKKLFEWTVEQAALRLRAPVGKKPIWFWLDLLKKESAYFKRLNGSSNHRRSELDSETLCSLEREIKVSDGGVIELPCKASAEYCIKCDTQEQLKAATSKSENVLRPPGPATPLEASDKKPTDPAPSAPKPPTMLSGTGGFAPKASSVPQERPPRFSKDLWPRTKVILLKAQSEFPLEEDALNLCNYITKEMTPLFLEAVKTGKMEAESVERLYGGESEDLLGLLLICNAGRGDLGGLSDAAHRLRKDVWKSKEWFAMVEAIANAQQSKSETTLEKSKAGARLAEPEKSAGVPAEAVDADYSPGFHHPARRPASRLPSSPTGREKADSFITSQSAVARMNAYIAKHKLRIEDFAEKAKTSTKTIYNFKRTGRARHRTLRDIAVAMDVTPEALTAP